MWRELILRLLRPPNGSKKEAGLLVGGRILIEQQCSFPLRDDEVDGG